ncbi:MAG: DUF433 domain-containing protein [Armatimonadota bacterium]|nr:DUF433 domain-containing protein [Armatimonadota bacterium]MDW8142157.1 DUF433 domain-containing protein [Armatimonadota bacterium]
MAEVKERKVVRTEHPHIVKVEGVRGGDEVIEGSRMAVWMVANHWRMGMSPEEIAQEFQLPLSHVFDALSYYLDHQTEIDRQIEEAKSFPQHYNIDEQGFVCLCKRHDEVEK